MAINIKKLIDSDTSTIYLDEEHGWISNGHWAIRIKDTLKPELLATIPLAEAYIGKSSLTFREQGIEKWVADKTPDLGYDEIERTPLSYQASECYSYSKRKPSVTATTIMIGKPTHGENYLVGVRSSYLDVIDENNLGWYGKGPDEPIVMRTIGDGVVIHAVLMPARSEAKQWIKSTYDALFGEKA